MRNLYRNKQKVLNKWFFQISIKIIGQMMTKISNLNTIKILNKSKHKTEHGTNRFFSQIKRKLYLLKHLKIFKNFRGLLLPIVIFQNFKQHQRIWVY